MLSAPLFERLSELILLPNNILYIVIFSVLLIYVFVASLKLKNLQATFLAKVLNILEEHFAAVGVDKKFNEKHLQLSPTTVVVYASGREYCRGWKALVQFSPLNDPLRFLAKWVYPEFYPPHKVTISIEIDEKVNGFLFIAGKSNHVRKVKNDRYDVKTCGKAVTQSVPKGYSCLSDLGNVTASELVVALQQAYERSGFQYLLITDSYKRKPEALTDKPERLMEISFSFDDINECFFYVEMSIYLLDFIGEHLNVSVEAKKNINKARLAIKDDFDRISRKEREEASQQKKIDKKKEMEKKVAKLSPEEQRKFDEKEKKKEMKKKMKKGKMIIMG